MANELETLLPALEAMGMGSGAIKRDGGFAAVTRRFIDGRRLAAERGEDLRFE
jgi:hypothetical protein